MLVSVMHASRGLVAQRFKLWTKVHHDHIGFVLFTYGTIFNIHFIRNVGTYYSMDDMIITVQ